jgi:hypothetical protein
MSLPSSRSCVFNFMFQGCLDPQEPSLSCFNMCAAATQDESGLLFKCNWMHSKRKLRQHCDVHLS